MRGHRPFALISTICLAIIAAPAFALAAAFAFVDRAWSFLAEVTNPTALRSLFDTPHLAIAFDGGDQIDASLAHRQRHEAGLAILGAVRHC